MSMDGDAHGGTAQATAAHDAEAPVEKDTENDQSPQPTSGRGCRIFLWFCFGFLVGVILTQIPLPASPFTKELRKDSEDIHEFVVDERKAVAGATASVEGAIPGIGGPTRTRTFTTTTSTTPLPDPIFVTLQTKGSSLLEKVGGPFKVVNLGKGKPWHGYKTKFQLLLPFLNSRHDDDLVAFMDGTDIFWGGCEMSDFLHYYQQIVEASGASIVISAEIACGEQARECSAVPTVPEWANHLANRSLNTGFWRKYVSPKGCGGDGCPCHEPPQVMFLNSGFIMGTVKALKPVIAWALHNYNWASTLGDQSVLAKYWIIHPHEFALDYQGSLCLSTSDLNPVALFAKDPQTGAMWNKAFGRMQCLTHGNGRGRYALWDLLGRFSTGKHGERYAKALKYKRL